MIKEEKKRASEGQRRETERKVRMNGKARRKVKKSDMIRMMEMR